MKNKLQTEKIMLFYLKFYDKIKKVSSLINRAVMLSNLVVWHLFSLMMKE